MADYKPKARWSEDMEEEINYPESLNVVEGDYSYTGILDQYGNRLYRVKQKIGFR